MKKPQIKATSLRALMLVVIFIIVVILGAGFYYAQLWLGEFASVPSTSVLSANDLAILKNDISSHKVAADKVSAMLASTTGYKTQIQQDLNKYASTTGVVIASYDSLQPSAVKVNSLQITGVTSNFVEVKLKNPVPFVNLIKFIKAIETNLPKMKITGINITRAVSPEASVTVDPITIEVYTKL